MPIKKVIVYTAFFVNLIACSYAIKPSQKKDDDTVVCKFPRPDDDALPSGMSLYEGAIRSLRYDAASHALVVGLSYSGCEKVPLTLKMGECGASYPMQCTAKLYRPSPDSDSVCDMAIEEEQSLSLDASFNMATVSLAGGDGKRISVMVDKHGETQTQIFAGDIKDLSYDEVAKEIVVTIGYGGGCQQHEFSLDFSADCLAADKMEESKTCTAQLQHVRGSADPCEAYATQVLRYSLKDIAAKGPYKLVVAGRRDKKTLDIP